MAKPANLLAGFRVFLKCLFFKSSNEDHHSKPVAFDLAYRFRNRLGRASLGYDVVRNGHCKCSRCSGLVGRSRRPRGSRSRRGKEFSGNLRRFNGCKTEKSSNTRLYTNCRPTVSPDQRNSHPPSRPQENGTPIRASRRFPSQKHGNYLTNPSFLAMCSIKSTTRLEYPHSLSYQETT